jgi:hypothetical protein
VKVKKGDLVNVRRPSDELFPSDVTEHGAVVDYRPDVLGGSSLVSYRTRSGGWKAERVEEPRRGEVLVLSYVDGGLSWYDELNVKIVGDKDE